MNGYGTTGAASRAMREYIVAGRDGSPCATNQCFAGICGWANDRRHARLKSPARTGVSLRFRVSTAHAGFVQLDIQHGRDSIEYVERGRRWKRERIAQATIFN